MTLTRFETRPWYSAAELAERFGRSVAEIEAVIWRHSNWPRLKRNASLKVGVSLDVFAAALGVSVPSTTLA